MPAPISFGRVRSSMSGFSPQNARAFNALASWLEWFANNFTAEAPLEMDDYRLRVALDAAPALLAVQDTRYATVLAAPVGLLDSVITVQSAAQFPAAPGFAIVIDNEPMIVTGFGGSQGQVWGVARSQPALHAAGAIVTQAVSPVATSLGAGMGINDTALVVTGLGTFPSEGWFWIAVGGELMLVVAGAGTLAWTVQRMNLRAAYPAGTPVFQVLPDVVRQVGRIVFDDQAFVQPGPLDPVSGKATVVHHEVNQTIRLVGAQANANGLFDARLQQSNVLPILTGPTQTTQWNDGMPVWAVEGNGVMAASPQLYDARQIDFLQGRRVYRFFTKPAPVLVRRRREDLRIEEQRVRRVSVGGPPATTLTCNYTDVILPSAGAVALTWQLAAGDLNGGDFDPTKPTRLTLKIGSGILGGSPASPPYRVIWGLLQFTYTGTPATSGYVQIDISRNGAGAGNPTLELIWPWNGGWESTPLEAAAPWSMDSLVTDAIAAGDYFEVYITNFLGAGVDLRMGTSLLRTALFQ
jgi:hypothetical protein